MNYSIAQALYPPIPRLLRSERAGSALLSLFEIAPRGDCPFHPRQGTWLGISHHHYRCESCTLPSTPSVTRLCCSNRQQTLRSVAGELPHTLSYGVPNFLGGAF